MKSDGLIPHLFRTEYSKIVAVLCKHFGLTHIEVAEDIASETFASAAESWPYRGVPNNPAGWLYTVAKNKLKNYLHRDQIFGERVAKEWQLAARDAEEWQLDLSDLNIKDSQLKMLFTVCHPAIPPEAQIGLALRILCGFGIDEIATAFLASKDTINKRLYRAKETLREQGIRMELPSAIEIDKRLDQVLTTLYLLFNEGYYSESNDDTLREDLCREAMRLMSFLLENDRTDLPKVNALLALMCFHASRFKARKDERGAMVLYNDQDERLWDREMISRGATLLRKASQGNILSRYHIEAGIAYWHTVKEDSPEKWESILHLYNQLLRLEYSPVAALNRTYALFRARGRAEAIAEAEKLRLTNYHYYFALLGELYTGFDTNKARENFERALQLAKTKTDRELLTRKMALIK